MPPSPAQLTIGQCATLACLLEATAPKVGNVHRGADFADLTFLDFAVAGVAIAPAIESAEQTGVGAAVLAAIEATRRMTATNVNLGIALLLAPLAAVPRSEPLSSGVATVLASLQPVDSQQVYAAIRLAQPGGMGEVEAMDVAGAAPDSLLDAMQAAAERDLIAAQYTTNFHIVLNEALPHLLAGQQRGWSLTTTIVHAHLQLLAEHPDSLIVRKVSRQTADRVSRLAQQVLDCGQPEDDVYLNSCADFDFWLRSDGNRRNPGTTADLIAAALFAGLRDGLLQPPYN